MNKIDPIERLVKSDPYLEPYRGKILERLLKVEETLKRITRNKMDLCTFASGHLYFGLHREDSRWVIREWAPNATRIYLVGDMTGWRKERAFAFERIDDRGTWELVLPDPKMAHKQKYRLWIHWPGGSGERIPAYADRVVQNPETKAFDAQVWKPEKAYPWKVPDFTTGHDAPLIYEVHVGMSLEEGRVGTFNEFREQVLPRIKRSGYNTLQIMGVPEHPYYGSFGYHVSSFFAVSSRFGTPDDFKALVDAAHQAGLAVIIDLVHSHSVTNHEEGLGLFDGTSHLYFHERPRGYHKFWDSLCFDYGKPDVLHFLLSNCRYWLETYHVDGFRFDGVTSMLYLDHGLERAFTSYDDYFNDQVDEEALVYMALANRLIHDLNPRAITIAEDISGMPGLALPIQEGGLGFDFRFAMGIPDFWIRLIKEIRFEDWPMGGIWHELTNRRYEERTISYAESHDQALVGDKTLAFRLMGADMYAHMAVGSDTLKVNHGMALHKIIRFITLATAGSGYLNFMGNEFGHPEWIDFPRKENNWSYHYARRQWHLADDPDLKYGLLNHFDNQMIALVKQFDILNTKKIHLLHEHHVDKVIAFERGGLLFVFNFHPLASHADYFVHAPSGTYKMIFNSDLYEFGGHNRLTPGQTHHTLKRGGEPVLSLYIPSQCALVLKRDFG